MPLIHLYLANVPKNYPKPSGPCAWCLETASVDGWNNNVNSLKSSFQTFGMVIENQGSWIISRQEMGKF